MKAILLVLSLSVILTATAAGKSLEDYVAEAQSHQEAGDFEKAAATMEQAVSEFPDDPDGYAYLGLYKTMQAGPVSEAGDFMQAGRLSSEAIAMLEKAIELDPDHARAHLYRGILGVNLPEFMGVLDQGIADLEFVARRHEEYPDEVPTDLAVTAYQFLGQGYVRKKQNDIAKAAWEKVIDLAPGSPDAQAAQERIAGLAPQLQPAEPGEFDGLTPDELKARLEAEPDNVELLVALGKAYLDEESYAEADKVLREAISRDSLNAGAYKWLGTAMAYSMEGDLYDERIHENTDWATMMAFEIIGYLDKAVELAPGDVEARLLHGMMAVMFPFFVGKLDQGIDNLQMVLDSGASDEMKAQAAYGLGYAYQKKGMTFWIDVVKDYPEDEAARLVFDGMLPPVRHFDPSKHARPVVAVDFVLGFRDELPPQTAVWVETERGKFVRTLYVSGFSGHAREVQVVLPVWASTSKFADADAITGASIDIGEHVYVWDLKDAAGSMVEPGSYVVKVETHYWPSMKYQMVSAPISVGESEDRVVVEEGDFIPYLEARYLP
jgi:tetratricopeptide (TPR) repeat protein